MLLEPVGKPLTRPIKEDGSAPLLASPAALTVDEHTQLRRVARRHAASNDVLWIEDLVDIAHVHQQLAATGMNNLGHTFSKPMQAAVASIARRPGWRQ